MAAGVKIIGLGKFDHNPRGNLWAKDESTFGYKLLKKMGWNKGQGLGKNNDGISECIKIKKRNTNNGLGYQHQVTNLNELEYNSILSNLCKRYTSLNKEKSSNLPPGLEQRSQQFKNRLHYRKFVQGKDICRYSERDMKSIFLTGNTEEKEAKRNSKSIPEIEPTADANTDHKFSFMYESPTNMEDYFSKKLKSKPNDSLNNIIKYADDEDNSTDPVIVASTEDGSVADYESTPKKKRKMLKDNNKVSKKKKLLNSEQLCIEEEHAIAEASVTAESDSLSGTINHADNEDNSIDSALVAIKENGSVADHESTPKKKWKIHSNKNKASKLIKLENSEQYSVEEASVIVESENSDLPLVIENNVLPIKEKKHKKSKTRLLKSCLNKIVNPSGFKKNVSFNDTIDYKLIEDEFLEKVVICEPSEITNDVCDENHVESETNEEPTDFKHLSTTTENTEDEKCFTELDDIEISDEDIKKYECLHFPKVGKGIINSWIESQKQASKLTLYKNAIKNIKRHHIFQSTNLLDIKGYGNWGF